VDQKESGTLKWRLNELFKHCHFKEGFEHQFHQLLAIHLNDRVDTASEEAPSVTLTELLSRPGLAPLVTRQFKDVSIPLFGKKVVAIEIDNLTSLLDDQIADDRLDSNSLVVAKFTSNQPAFDVVLCFHEEKVLTLIGFELKSKERHDDNISIPPRDVIDKCRLFPGIIAPFQNQCKEFESTRLEKWVGAVSQSLLLSSRPLVFFVFHTGFLTDDFPAVLFPNVSKRRSSKQDHLSSPSRISDPTSISKTQGCSFAPVFQASNWHCAPTLRLLA